MSSSFQGNPNNLLPENYIIPEEESERNLKIRQYLNDIAVATNTKSSGIYDASETITGKRFLPVFGTGTSTNANYRSVFRTVINFGALPNATTTSVAHGISTTQNFSFVKIYGTATDPGASTVTAAIPIPYINTTTPGDSVQINVDATNVNITTTTANYTAYTRCFVVLEYIKTV